MQTPPLKHRRLSTFLFLFSLAILQGLASFKYENLAPSASTRAVGTAVAVGAKEPCQWDELSRPTYQPILPATSHSPRGTQKKLTSKYSQDYRHYFYFVDESSSKVPPASLMDIPAKTWSPQEKADIVAILTRIMKRSPGLIINASSDTKIALYRTKELNSAIASANPGILTFEDKFFFRSDQYDVLLHELVHLCNLSSILSESPEWQSILEPAVAKAQKENQPTIEEIIRYGYDLAQETRLHRLDSKTTQERYKLQDGHACLNLAEALASNCAHYLTTGTVLTGGGKFRRLVQRDLLEPSSSTINFRKHYTTATIAAVKLNLKNYDRAMQLALGSLSADQRKRTIPQHLNTRLQIVQSLAEKSFDRQGIDALIAENKYDTALKKIGNVLSLYESKRLILPPKLAANLALEASRYYEYLHRYKDSALAYEKGICIITSNNNDDATIISGTLDKAELAQEQKDLNTQQLWANCARYYLLQGHYPEAIACCQKAEKAGGNIHDALLIEIEALEKMKADKEARLMLGRFLEYCDQRKATVIKSTFIGAPPTIDKS